MSNDIPRVFILGTIVVLLILIFPYLLIPVNSQTISLGGPPYLDSVLFVDYDEPNRQVQALLDGDADLVGDFVDHSFLSALEDAESIDIFSTPSNGYGHLLLNTAKYPLNHTLLRRAIAFALDKERIVDDVWGDEAEPLDVIIPRNNPFSAEGILLFDYYDSRVDIGTEILNRAGFIDTNSDGYLEAPNGQPFSLELVNVFDISPWTLVCQIVVESIQELGINCTLSQSNYGIRETLTFHGDYDLAFLEWSFSRLDVRWMAYEFWSEFADEPYWNPANFKNSTFDSLRAEFLYSTDYEQVYQTSVAMQELIAYECPIIVCYEGISFSAYRTDTYEGFVNDTQDGVASWWSSYTCQRHSSTSNLGGTLRWAIDELPDSLNFLSHLPTMARKIVQHVWGSLLVRDYNGDILPWFADSYHIETSSDNPNVTEGSTRLTFELVHNILWSDGEPLDANDVVFSINFLNQTQDTRFSPFLQNITHITNQSQYTVVIEIDSESYWHLENIGLIPILPSQAYGTFDPEDWQTIEPLSLLDLIPISGPFNISMYEVGDSCLLMSNQFFFKVSNSETTTPTTVIPGSLPIIIGIVLIIATLVVLEFGIRRVQVSSSH